MKKSLTVTIIASALMLAACSTTKEIAAPVLLEGDWVSARPPGDEWGRSNRPSIFSFTDSLGSALSAWAPYQPYHIIKDTLRIDSSGDFRILKHTRDSLVLTQHLPEENQTDTFYLARVKASNEFRPDRILFASSPCFGTCPVQTIEIDSNRNIRFLGQYHTRLAGGHSGQLSEAAYQDLLDRIQALPLDSIQRNYQAQWTDDQTSAIILRQGNKLVQSRAYGFNQEPVELRLLFHYLMELYKRTPLTPDTSVNESYFTNRDSLYSGMLTQPEP